MATQSELRWIRENPGYFSPDVADGVVARYAQKWYLEPEQAGTRPDATDSAMFNEFSLTTPGFTPTTPDQASEQSISQSSVFSPANAVTADSYLSSRPDLQANWDRAHDQNWIASNPGSKATVDYINKFGSLTDYLEADRGSPFYSAPRVKRDVDTNQGGDNPTSPPPSDVPVVPVVPAGNPFDPSNSTTNGTTLDPTKFANPNAGFGVIPVNDDPTVIGSSTYDPTGGRGGSVSTGVSVGASNYPIDNSNTIFSGSSGGVLGGLGQGGMILPIPGIDWPTAIGASILLSGGNPLAGGGSIQGTINQIGNIASNPIGATSSAISNLGNSIGDFMGPQGIGTAILPTISFPSSGGSTPSSSPISFPSQTPAPTAVIPVEFPKTNTPSNTINFPNPIPNQGSGATVVAPLPAGPPSENPSSSNPILFPQPTDNTPSTPVVPVPSPIQPPVTPVTSPIESTTPPIAVAPILPPISTPGPIAPVETPTPPTAVAPIPIQQAPGPYPTQGTDTVQPPPTIVAPIPTPNPTVTNEGPVQNPTPVVPIPSSLPTDTPIQNPTPVVPTPGSGGGSPTIVNPVPITPMPDTSVASPLLRNFYNEGNQSTYDLQRLLAGMAGLYGDASGQSAQTDFNNWQSILNQFGGQNAALTGQANQQTVDSNTALRQGNVDDVGALGGQALGYLQQLNPNQYAALNQSQAGAGALGTQNQYQQQLGQMFSQGPQYSQVNPQTGFNAVQTGYNARSVNPQTGYTGVQTQFSGPQVNAQTGFNNVNAQTGDAGLNFASGQLNQIAPSSIQQLLEKQALDNLNLGGSLSDQERNLASQTAREAWGARGLINSQGAVGDEILNTDALSRQRLAERQAAAQSIDSQGFGQRQQGFTNALGYSNAAQNYGQQSLVAQQANQGAQLQGNQLNYNSQLANQNLAAQLAQLGLSGQQSNLSAQLAGNQLGYQGQLANQNTDLQLAQLAQQGQQSNLQAQLQGNQLGYQGQLANQNAGLQAQQQNYNLGESLLNADYGRQQQNYANILGNAQLQTQAAFNPFATITSANTANQGTNQGLFNNSSALSSGQLGNQYVQQQYNPFQPYAGDVFSSNQNATTASNIAASNNAAAAAGANTAASSSIASGFLGLLGQYYANRPTTTASPLCWVARECFGSKDSRWLEFRDWLLTDSPRWFRALYIKHGEKFAAWLKRNEWAKPPIRAFMQNRIDAHKKRVQHSVTNLQHA